MAAAVVASVAACGMRFKTRPATGGCSPCPCGPPPLKSPRPTSRQAGGVPQGASRRLLIAPEGNLTSWHLPASRACVLRDPPCMRLPAATPTVPAPACCETHLACHTSTPDRNHLCTYALLPQDPVFSSCTVPLLMYPSWRGNFFHIFKGRSGGCVCETADAKHAMEACACVEATMQYEAAAVQSVACNRHAPAPHADLSAVYYAMLRRTPWRQHAKLVVVTPDGLPLTQPESQLLPTLSKLSVQSLADFSRRLLPGHQIGQEVRAQSWLAKSRKGRCAAGWVPCNLRQFLCDSTALPSTTCSHTPFAPAHRAFLAAGCLAAARQL